MTYVKGYKIDRQKVASMVEVDCHDPEVDEYIRVIVHQLPRSAYKYITAAKEHNPPADPMEDGHLALIIVLEAGQDEKTLREKEIVVDESIEWAKPHVLVGPDIWEVA
ncbi:hypothetical protein BYT27DRAFT_7197315 [Phlegmacium glaucopus]|nr:hypothetical protein BYT27DRAFT_7197315 [Phlegmacium glaucopus]